MRKQIIFASKIVHIMHSVVMDTSALRSADGLSTVRSWGVPGLLIFKS